MVCDHVSRVLASCAFIWLTRYGGSTVTASSPEGVSKFADTMFDSAFNLTQEEGDLKHVRWARIDYLNVTRITTKWNVWS